MAGAAVKELVGTSMAFAETAGGRGAGGGYERGGRAGRELVGRFGAHSRVRRVENDECVTAKLYSVSGASETASWWQCTVIFLRFLHWRRSVYLTQKLDFLKVKNGTL